MTMLEELDMNTAMLDQIKKLSYPEKLQLVEDVWDDIAQEAAAQPITEELKAELRRRLAEHREHPETSIPWEEAMAALESRFS
ncbi:MAG: hypothetical protein CO126_04525 [Hydrogenophilales bacterium CG_4_9_14_3_um_filter_63_34]|nr:MAG: hypothetical protein COZ24_14435 [Hydrogenophilales bacterium CG_4_10_14_3_um_filter_63_21]PJB04779.1 MAG: hypothetical protein CO126_04525 [Hydrogenophilales bacterium CG_4_9_14_3_um_filter_63_34]